MNPSITKGCPDFYSIQIQRMLGIMKIDNQCSNLFQNISAGVFTPEDKVKFPPKYMFYLGLERKANLNDATFRARKSNYLMVLELYIKEKSFMMDLEKEYFSVIMDNPVLRCLANLAGTPRPILQLLLVKIRHLTKETEEKEIEERKKMFVKLFNGFVRFVVETLSPREKALSGLMKAYNLILIEGDEDEIKQAGDQMVFFFF
jgi:hypothetical protein